MKIPFTYALHDRKDSFHEFLWDSIGTRFEFDDWTDEDFEALAQKVGMPFYEIVFTCELDTEDGGVTVLEVQR